MKRWPGLGVIWLLLQPLGAAAADDPALAAIDACRAMLDARRDIGLERISRRCPDLLPALRVVPWKNLLPLEMNGGVTRDGAAVADRREEITAAGLGELAELVRAANRAAERAAPDIARLSPVLAELGEQGQQGATRWERFKRWLQDTLEQRDDEADEKSLLGDFGRKFETSEGVAQFISYLGYALVFLLVCLVIGSELRAAGLFGGMRREAHAAATAWRRRLLLTDVLAAPLSERPGLLLKLLGEALTRAHRLPAADGLTAASLARQAQLDSEAQRGELERVAATADAVRYGSHPPDPEKLAGAVHAARALLEEIAALKSAPPRRNT